jgi:hypothetical protein
MILDLTTRSLTDGNKTTRLTLTQARFWGVNEAVRVQSV